MHIYNRKLELLSLKLLSLRHVYYSYVDIHDAWRFEQDTMRLAAYKHFKERQAEAEEALFSIILGRLNFYAPGLFFDSDLDFYFALGCRLVICVHYVHNFYVSKDNLLVEAIANHPEIRVVENISVSEIKRILSELSKELAAIIVLYQYSSTADTMMKQRKFGSVYSIQFRNGMQLSD